MSFRSLRSTHTPVSATVVHLASRVLVPIAILLTTYLYLYPVFLGCVFPSTNGQFAVAFGDTLGQHIDPVEVNPFETRPHLAPFRLLVLADPQLEGDSSLPKPEDALGNKTAQYWGRLRSLQPEDAKNIVGILREIVNELVFKDIPRTIHTLRKRLDLFGNDYYLAHIFRTMHWWTKPTHVTVLGDLIGSQWVDDEEFDWRGWRYWNRVFARASMVPNDIMQFGRVGGGISMPMDHPEWKTRIVNIVGNHDIGYAGDISKERLDRFEQMYGKVNWDVRFEYPASKLDVTTGGVKPSLHMVILNSMLLDSPPLEEELQTITYSYLNDLITNRVRPVEDRTDFTLLLTHVPLHKEEGVCVDAPLFQFFDEDNCTKDCKIGGLKEQNHLSKFTSRNGILQSLFGMGGNLKAPAQGRGRPGLVLNGHDHEGCDVWHYIPVNSTFDGSEQTDDGEEKTTVWDASKWKSANTSNAYTGVREVTLRSMMGEFHGNAGLLSAWFDFETGEWQHDIRMCQLGVQHVWWAIHIIDLIAIGSVVFSSVLKLQQYWQRSTVEHAPRSKSTKIE